MPRTIAVFDIAVIMRTLIVITDYERNRCSGRIPFKNAGKNLDCIRFSAGSSEFTLTRFSAVKKCLYIISGERNPGGTSVYDAPRAGPWDSPQVVILNKVPKVDPAISVSP